MRAEFHYSIVATISLRHCRHDNLFIKTFILFFYSASRSSLLSSTLQNTATIRRKIDWILKKFLNSHRKYSLQTFFFRDWARYKDFNSFKLACWIQSCKQWRQSKIKRQTSTSSQRKQWNKKTIQMTKNSTKEKIFRIQSFH